MTKDEPHWPWPGDTACERARRIANSLLALLSEGERDIAVRRAHAVGETWLGGSLIRHELDDKVSTAEAAQLIHVKPSTIRKWHSEGDLRAVGRGYYLVRDVLDCSAARRARRVAV